MPDHVCCGDLRVKFTALILPNQVVKHVSDFMDQDTHVPANKEDHGKLVGSHICKSNVAMIVFSAFVVPYSLLQTTIFLNDRAMINYRIASGYGNGFRDCAKFPDRRSHRHRTVLLADRSNDEYGGAVVDIDTVIVPKALDDLRYCYAVFHPLRRIIRFLPGCKPNGQNENRNQ